MPLAEAAVTTRYQAASKIRLDPAACQNSTSKSRPGARPRVNLSIMTRSAIALLSYSSRRAAIGSRRAALRAGK